jgi:two-component system, NtrC family, response regulator HydG
MPHKEIILIDDDINILALAERVLENEALDLKCFANGTDFIQQLEAQALKPSLLLCDINLPDMKGFELLQRTHAYNPGIPFVMVTSDQNPDSIIRALRLGATDYIVKPFSPRDLRENVLRILKIQDLRDLGKKRPQRIVPGVDDDFSGIIGRSPAMQRLYSTISKVAPSTASILVHGESGTGKELVARALHESSPRANKPFKAINCAAIPGELLESELFGHKKGSFTGADSKHVGLFEAATGGTIFLDEIGDMPLLLQAKLLRVLQDSKIRPVGSNEEITIDVRIVAATHQNLPTLVQEKRFREDLFFRLNVIPLEIPALRDRPEDFPLLVGHFLKKFSQLHNKNIETIHPRVIQAFHEYAWPGNVRELENAIERAVLLSDKSHLDAVDFSWILDASEPKELRPHNDASSVSVSHNVLMNGNGHAPSSNGSSSHFASNAEEIHNYFKVPLSVSLKELEDKYIQAYCQAHPHLSREDVAAGLGINRKTLYRKFQDLKEGTV